MHIRVSLGSAILLGLRNGRMDAPPTTIYIMLGESCLSDCLYCTQARGAPRTDRLSRVVWPPFPEEVVIDAITSGAPPVERVCIQTLGYGSMLDDLRRLVRRIVAATNLPVSASIPPVGRGEMVRVANAGLSTAGIAIDEACDGLFDAVRPAFGGLEAHWRALSDALDVLDGAALHLIAGLGETDEEILRASSRALSMGAHVALFAYMPVTGRLPFSRPPVERYRALQAAVRLLSCGIPFDRLRFDRCGRLIALPRMPDGDAFRTSGCPGCNRPYYNESPGGPLYNFPRTPTPEEVGVAIDALGRYGVALMADDPLGTPGRREGCG